jgi:hypothetical protein
MNTIFLLLLCIPYSTRGPTKEFQQFFSVLHTLKVGASYRYIFTFIGKYVHDGTAV